MVIIGKTIGLSMYGPLSSAEVSLGSFSIDDGDGSEYVTDKTNARFFKLCRAYSSSLKMSM